MSEQTAATYTHGHHESVLRSHTWRTAANSAAYLLPHLRPDMRILDVGCGPGTISIDLATYVPQGSVVGVDASADPFPIALETAAKKGVTNITFAVADAAKLPYEDDSFDVVHAHQVLQHVGDPVQMLREMKRVCKAGGVVAAREGDFGIMTWYPESTGLLEFKEAYIKIARANGGEPRAGTRLHAWAKQADFDGEQIKLSASTWVYSTAEERKWWSEMWADRVLKSSFKESALKTGLVGQAELEVFANAWKEWGAEPDGLTMLVNGEILAFV